MCITNREIGMPSFQLKCLILDFFSNIISHSLFDFPLYFFLFYFIIFPPFCRGVTKEFILDKCYISLSFNLLFKRFQGLYIITFSIEICLWMDKKNQ